MYGALYVSVWYVCVFVCIYICVYMYVNVNVSVCIYIYIYIYILYIDFYVYFSVVLLCTIFIIKKKKYVIITCWRACYITFYIKMSRLVVSSRLCQNDRVTTVATLHWKVTTIIAALLWQHFAMAMTALITFIFWCFSRLCLRSHFFLVGICIGWIVKHCTIYFASLCQRSAGCCIQKPHHVRNDEHWSDAETSSCADCQQRSLCSRFT